MKLTDVTDYLGVTNTAAREAVPASNPVFNLEAIGEKRTLYENTTDSRPPRKALSKKNVKTLLIVFGIISLFLVIIQEFIVILVAASLIFISYILSEMPPEKVHYEISNHGITYDSKHYYWNEFGEFYFTYNDGSVAANVTVLQGLPALIYLIVDEKDKDKVKDIIGTYLPYLEEAPKDFMDSAYDNIVGKFNF